MQEPRETDCEMPPLPCDLAGELEGYRWARSSVGMSGCDVYRLSGAPDAPDLYLPDLYLKVAAGPLASDLADEFARLHWLSRHLAVPQIKRFAYRSNEAFLLMTALLGETAYQALERGSGDAAPITDALADFLRTLHAIPVHDCPFTSDAAYRLARARERIDAGLVEEDDFDAEREGWTAEQVWQALEDLPPLDPDPVVTHGDYSLDNLLVANGQVVGCIDVGRAGIADRYQDIAIAWNSLGEFGEDLQRRFLARYGVPEPDGDKLRFHLLLDELF